MPGASGPEVVTVACQPDGDGWACTVTVGDDTEATTHQVTVTTEVRDQLAGPGGSIDRLVRESFAFLLARESRESILRRFDLPVIGQYFPEYDAEIRRRLSG
jgi:hypothetical protein